MVKRTVDLKDASKEIGKYYENHNDIARAMVISGIAKSLPEIIANSPVDTGLYAQSWDMIETESSVFLGNYAPHAAIIERGARPFTPPLGPLLAWAKRILQDTSQPPDYSQEVWALAIYTRNKIQKYGMEPKHIMEKSIPMILENIREELQRVTG